MRFVSQICFLLRWAIGFRLVQIEFLVSHQTFFLKRLSLVAFVLVFGLAAFANNSSVVAFCLIAFRMITLCCSNLSSGLSCLRANNSLMEMRFFGYFLLNLLVRLDCERTCLVQKVMFFILSSIEFRLLLYVVWLESKSCLVRKERLAYFSCFKCSVLLMFDIEYMKAANSLL